MSAHAIGQAFALHRRRVWGIGYRMTGSLEDADEVVQDTFTRALEAAPSAQARSLEPWLVRVATNLAIDKLRKRKRAAYLGQWLPEPLLIQDQEREILAKEALSMTMLGALEQLSATQRAVFILRGLYGYSTSECAQALGLSLPQVKTTLHRARYLLHEAAQGDALTTSARAHDAALLQLMLALQVGDLEQVERLLAQDVRVVSDGAGEVGALLKIVEGSAKVLRFLSAAKRRGVTARQLQLLRTSAGIALYTELDGVGPRAPSRQLWWLTLNAQGQIREISMLVAPSKLDRVLRWSLRPQDMLL